MDAMLSFSQTTGIYTFMNSAWGWPIAESIHFLGLSLLLGCVGVFDLRMLGVARAIPLDALHRLVPFGVLGFALNLVTGIMFLTSAPDQYLYNPAVQLKMLFIGLAGANMLLFYRTVFRRAKSAAAGSTMPRAAMIMGAVSLLCWSMVIVWGRLITYFRPPYHWCWWC
ncbi:MAG: hypothetical protein WD772_07810 [Pseudohongiellaceae bacterium]